MNRIIIEPGIKQNEWSHIWMKSFKIILITQASSPNLSEADIKWLNLKNYVSLDSILGRQDQPNPINIAETATQQGFPLRSAWYSPSEVKAQSDRRKAERESHQTENPTCP